MLTLVCGVWRKDGSSSEDDLGPMCGALSFGRKAHIDKVRLGAFSCAHVTLCTDAVGVVAGPEVSQSSDSDLLVGDIRADGLAIDGYHDRLNVAFSKQGWKAATHPDGDFAIAHWNSGAQRLCLARDHIGARPLFFTYKPGAWLAFASFPEALTAAGFVSGEPDFDILSKAAVGNRNHGTHTYLQGVHRVLPAHVLTFQHGFVEQHRYWRLICSDPISESADFTETAKQLQDHVRGAVRRRLPASGSIATELSGGLDSSAIAAIASSELASDDIRAPDRMVWAYNFRPRQRSSEINVVDEFNHAAAVAQQRPNLRVQSAEYGLPEAPIQQTFSPSFPVEAGQEGHYNKFFSDAASKGASIMFSGYGGDELVSYNGRGLAAEYLCHLKWGRLSRLLEERANANGHSKWHELGADVLRYVLPSSLAGKINRWRGVANSGSLALDKFLKPAHRSNAVAREMTLCADTRKNRITLSESGHLGIGMERLAWEAAQHGMRYVFPLTDKTLQEFAIRLPGGFYDRGGSPRAIFREAMDGILPEMVRTRRTKGRLDSAAALTVLENKQAYLDALDSLEQGQPKDFPFNLEAMRRAIKDLPDPETLVRKINTSADEGEQYRNIHTIFAFPMMMALYAKQSHKNRPLELPPEGGPPMSVVRVFGPKDGLS